MYSDWTFCTCTHTSWSHHFISGPCKQWVLNFFRSTKVEIGLAIFAHVNIATVSPHYKICCCRAEPLGNWWQTGPDRDFRTCSASPTASSAPSRESKSKVTPLSLRQLLNYHLHLVLYTKLQFNGGMVWGKKLKLFSEGLERQSGGIKLQLFSLLSSFFGLKTEKADQKSLLIH